MTGTPDTFRDDVVGEMDHARAVFHALLDAASDTGLRRPSRGTRWTNEQLLFHMLFGYIIVRALLGVVRLFGALPPQVSKAYAALLDSAIRPFDAINYWGSRVGAVVYPRRRMGPKLDRVIASLQRRLDRTDTAALSSGMHFPTTWDPFFRDYMTLREVYRYPTQHFDFHQDQLTLGDNSQTSPRT